MDDQLQNQWTYRVHRLIASVQAKLPLGLPHVIIANIAQQALAFVGVIVIARLLPAEEFALVRIAIAYAAVATILGAGGLTAPVLRYCADTMFDESQRRALLGKALVLLSLIAGATTIVCLILVALSGRRGDEAIVLMAYALQVPALAGTSLLLVYLQAVQRFKFLAYSQIVIRSLALCLTVLGAWLYGLPGLLLATITAAFCGVLPLLFAARPTFGRHPVTVPTNFFALTRYSLVGMMISSGGQYADLLILDWVAVDRSLVAVYSLATIFFFAVGALAGAVQSVATPHFTNLMRDQIAFKSSLRRWTLGLMMAGAVTAIGATGLAWAVEQFVLGSAYNGLGLMVAALMVRFWVWCTYAVGGAAMVGIGAIKQGTHIAAITTALAFFVGYPLVLWAGVWGAAATQVLVAVISALLVFRVIVREVKALPMASTAEKITP